VPALPDISGDMTPGKPSRTRSHTGYATGNRSVSEKHAGFVVNKGDATAKDVCELTDYIKSEVMEKFGVGLELEVVKVGF